MIRDQPYDHRSVFVVDGDTGARDFLRDMTHRMAFSARCFSSAESLLDVCQPDWSGCLVTELQLPKLNGLQLMDVLAGRSIHLPTIVLSDAADVPATVEAMQRGALSVLEKPCRELVLRGEIGRALDVEAQTRETRTRQRDWETRINSLTEQEREILEMVVRGYPNKRIASRMDISVRTVEERRKNIYRKTGTQCVADLVRFVCEVPQARVLPPRTAPVSGQAGGLAPAISESEPSRLALAEQPSRQGCCP